MSKPSAAPSQPLAPGRVGTSEEQYPLSPMQQGMLFHSLSAPDRGVDIEQMVCRLRERLDSAAFRHAWERLVDRHAALRARFVGDSGSEPVQVVEPAVPVPFEEADWRGLPGDEQTARLEAFLAADRRRGFEMERAPLMRLALFRRADADYQLVWTFHHALLDGRSLPLLLKELFAFYEASREGGDLFLPPPAPYREYIEWLDRQDFSRSEAFWRAQLKGFSVPTSVSLPPPERASSEEPGHGTRETHLSLRLTEALRAAARGDGVTLNTLIQGAWAALLSRYTGETDVLFGATRACRRSSLADGPERVGLFVNTLPVRVSVPPEARLGPWLQQLRAQQLAVREHEHTPLAQVQAWSDLPPGTPLFESIVMFDHTSLDAAMKARGGAWLNRDFRLVENTGYPLTLTAYGDTQLQLALAYDRQRYDEPAIARMLSHLETLLAGMAAQPDQPLALLPMLTEAEREQILVEWSGARREAPREATIAACFEAQVERAPDARAVVCGSQSLTFRELDERANQLAHHLRDRGVVTDSRVGICLERSLDMIVAVLAILKSGGAYVPLDPAYPEERLAFMPADTGVSVLVTQSSLRRLFPSYPGATVCVDAEADAIRAQPTARLAGEAAADQLAYVIYTSGSTGTPKGVGVPHRGVLRLVRGADYARLAADERFLQMAPLSFDASTFEIWGALLNGACLILYPAQTPDPWELREILGRHRVTTLWLTAGLFHQMVEHHWEALRGVRQLLAGGDVLSVPHVEQALQALPDCTLINGYGPTENTTFSCCYPIPPGIHEVGGGPRGTIPIGRPIAGSQAYVLDPNMQPAPIGVTGELYVGGDGLARGYLNRPELTAEKFVPHPFSDSPGARLYRTGDLARYRADGCIEFVGRRDQQVKIRGFRVELGEIEAALQAHPAIRQCVVVAHSDNRGDGAPAEKRLVAYGLSAVDPAPSSPELRRFLTSKLPEYMLPAAFVMLDSLPLTANGKVDRRALPAPGPERPELEGGFTAPRTPVEATLAAIWADVLRLDRVGVHDNFFDLGGDSILSLQIVGRARQVGLKLTPKQLFHYQTIARLAGEVRTDGETRVAEEVAGGPVPLTPIQRWFFEQEPADPHHYNQAMRLDVRPGLDPALWAQAIREVFGRHDVFRLRYACENGVWSQSHVEGAEPVSFAAIDLAGLTTAEERAVIDAVTAQAQGSLDLLRGPLARAIYLDRGPEQRGRLLLVVHHLIIDGVSWRILLEELQAAVVRPSPPAPLPKTAGRGAGGEGLSSLPPKTTSFQHWSRRLSEYARSSAMREEAAYWLSEAGAASPPLPRDFAGEENTVASEACVRVQLSAAETQALLRQAPAVHEAQINDLLLAALSEAMAAWTGAPSLRVDLEGHGREALFDGVDLSRTVGWFTSLFPVVLDLAAARGGGALPAVKQGLRRLPCRGVGYGVLRYLCEDMGRADRHRALPASEVSFNYLGQFDGMFADPAMMGSAWEWCRGARSPRQRRSHLLAIDGQTVGGRMEWVWTYSTAVHRRETIEGVADRFIAALRGLLPAELSLPSADEAVADLADVPLSPEKLDSLLAELDFDTVAAD